MKKRPFQGALDGVRCLRCRKPLVDKTGMVYSYAVHNADGWTCGGCWDKQLEPKKGKKR